MVKGSASLMCNSIFPRSSLVVHEVKVFQLWLHLCNPLYAWWLLSYNIVNLKDLLEWSKCEVWSAGSSVCYTVNLWCCRVWWYPGVSFLLHPSLCWCVACSPEWHIWWCLKQRWCGLEFLVVSLCCCNQLVDSFLDTADILSSPLFPWANSGHLPRKVEGFSWYVCQKLKLHQRKVLFSEVE